jgi:hypothetical protein
VTLVRKLRSKGEVPRRRSPGLRRLCEVGTASRELPHLEHRLKRIINGFEVDWASERVFAERQTAPNYGYLFEVSADRKRIVKCVHSSAIGGDADNPDGDAKRLEKKRKASC